MRAFSFHPNSRRARAIPASPNLRHSAGSLNNFFKTDAISSTFSGLTRKPVTPSRMESSVPPDLPPITGFPAAFASKNITEVIEVRKLLLRNEACKYNMIPKPQLESQLAKLALFRSLPHNEVSQIRHVGKNPSHRFHYGLMPFARPQSGDSEQNLPAMKRKSIKQFGIGSSRSKSVEINPGRDFTDSLPRNSNSEQVFSGKLARRHDDAGLSIDDIANPRLVSIPFRLGDLLAMTVNQVRQSQPALQRQRNDAGRAKVTGMNDIGPPPTRDS